MRSDSFMSSKNSNNLIIEHVLAVDEETGKDDNTILVPCCELNSDGSSTIDGTYQHHQNLTKTNNKSIVNHHVLQQPLSMPDEIDLSASPVDKRKDFVKSLAVQLKLAQAGSDGVGRQYLHNDLGIVSQNLSVNFICDKNEDDQALLPEEPLTQNTFLQHEVKNNINNNTNSNNFNNTAAYLINPDNCIALTNKSTMVDEQSNLHHHHNRKGFKTSVECIKENVELVHIKSLPVFNTLNNSFNPHAGLSSRKTSLPSVLQPQLRHPILPGISRQSRQTNEKSCQYGSDEMSECCSEYSPESRGTPYVWEMGKKA